MNWKRFIILIVSIVGVAGVAKLVMACSGGDPDPLDEQVLFLNTINNQPAFIPFFYTSSFTFFNQGSENNKRGFDDHLPDENIDMWARYTGGNVAKADIDSFVYTFSEAEVMNLYEHVAKGYEINVPEKVKNNGFTKWALKNKDKEALLYLSFAKSCEPYTTALESVWDKAADGLVTPKRDSAQMQLLVHEGLHQYEHTRNEELKLRYAYQVLRMAFYGREYQQTQDLFTRLLSAPVQNFLYYRCLCLKAGALYKTGKATEAAYLYSLAFDNSDDCKTKAYNSFRWAVNGNIDTVLAMCKNDHEKAVLYIMQGLYNYEGTETRMVNILKKAYELDPKVAGLDVVMTRFINKLETSMLEDIATAGKRQNSVIAGLNEFAQMAASEGKAGTKAYWTICAAYLYLLDGDMPACGRWLTKAVEAGMANNEQEVYATVNLLYMMRKDGKITTGAEAEMLPFLKTVEARRNEPRYRVLFSTIIGSLLRPAYMAQGDTIKAIYCSSKDRNDDEEDYQYGAGQLLDDMTPEKLRDVQAFVTKQNKSTFELWLTENTNYTEGELMELEGTKYMRMYQFGKAIQVLSKVPGGIIARQQLPDMLVSHILDGQDWNKTDSGYAYNKLEFARKMQQLKDTLDKNPNNSRAAYQYANGLYSMSYYGKGHHAYDYHRNTEDDLGYYDGENRNGLAGFEKEHYAVKVPERYYLQAFEHSTDKELKARCLFMAAKCWQKSSQADYYLNTFDNPHFKTLKKSYKGTKFYTMASGTCSYFRDYVRK